jgi:zinc/manganese transport system substrate-binding protein
MYRLRLSIVALVAALLLQPAQAADKVNVVATFSILADFVRNVGGERVEVTALVGPGADVHVYTPSPSDAKKIADARLVVVNGLGLEGWLPRLVKSSGGNATMLVATKGITPLKAHDDHHSDDHHGEADPHAWQSVADAKIYVGNIRDALVAVDPPGGETYRSNAEQYLAKLDALDREVRDEVAQIPQARRKVISSHEAFDYLGAAYGIAFVAPQGVSTDSEPSARDIAIIITQIRKEKIPAVFLENISDPRLVERIAAETGARIGGTLYSDSLTGEKGDAPTYIDMVRHNIRAVTSALKS